MRGGGGQGGGSEGGKGVGGKTDADAHSCQLIVAHPTLCHTLAPRHAARLRTDTRAITFAFARQRARARESKGGGGRGRERERRGKGGMGWRAEGEGERPMCAEGVDELPEHGHVAAFGKAVVELWVMCYVGSAFKNT